MNIELGWWAWESLLSDAPLQLTIHMGYAAARAIKPFRTRNHFADFCASICQTARLDVVKLQNRCERQQGRQAQHGRLDNLHSGCGRRAPKTDASAGLVRGRTRAGAAARCGERHGTLERTAQDPIAVEKSALPLFATRATGSARLHDSSGLRGLRPICVKSTVAPFSIRDLHVFQRRLAPQQPVFWTPADYPRRHRSQIRRGAAWEHCWGWRCRCG